jgi:hypothetical protein
MDKMLASIAEVKRCPTIYDNRRGKLPGAGDGRGEFPGISVLVTADHKLVFPYTTITYDSGTSNA